MKPTSKQALALFVAVALSAAAIDVVTKKLAVARLTDREPVQVIGDLLQLNLVYNPGAAFGTGASYTIVLSVIAIGALGTVLWFSRRLESKLWAVGLGLLLGGVAGNLADRVFREPGFLRGHVVDFLELPNWPVFNFADVFINLAAAIIVIQALRGVGVSGERVEKKRPIEPVGTTQSPVSGDDG